MSQLLELLKNRRSVYAIGNDIPLPDAELENQLGQLIKTMPTAFNMQSTRVALLLGKHHKNLWNNIVLEELRKVTPSEFFAKTESKINGFAAGHGTILFFDDSAVSLQYAKDNPLYKENFPIWAQQQNGMLQYAAWALLAEQHIGASLQHYNPLIDAGVQATWAIPSSWKLLAQIPFGRTLSPAGDKDQLSLCERLKIYDE